MASVSLENSSSHLSDSLLSVWAHCTTISAVKRSQLSAQPSRLWPSTELLQP